MKAGLIVLCALFLSVPAFAQEIPQHKTLKAYQELRLDVCKDLQSESLGQNVEADLLKHLRKTFRFLDKKKELAKGRARKVFKASLEEFERLVRDIQRGASHKSERIDTAFSQGAFALQGYLKDDIKRLEQKAKQSDAVEDDSLTGLDKELQTIEIEDEFVTPQLPDETSSQGNKPKNYLNFNSKNGKADRIELNCETLIKEDANRSFWEKLFG